MKINDLASRLKEMYLNPKFGKSTAVHLFGIRYADELQGLPLKEIVLRAGISKNYQTEIRKGVNLAKFVVEK